MKCPKCFTDIEDDSQFCKRCGAKVETPFPQRDQADQANQAARPPDVYRDPRHEKDVWKGRPCWRSYYGIWAVWLLAGLGGLYAAYRWLGAGSPGVTLAWVLVAGAAVAILVREALLVYGIRYRLTTQRLLVDRGIVTRVTDQMELIRVDDVRLRQGVVDRLVNTGEVEVMGTDETDETVVLQAVSHPVQVAEALRLHVRGVRGKGTLLVENI